MFGIDDALGFGSSLLGLFGHGDQKKLLKSQKALTDASLTNMNSEEAGKNAMIQGLTGYSAGTPDTPQQGGVFGNLFKKLGVGGATPGTPGTPAGSGGVAGFYDPYMKEGSPFLKQQQRASSETINKGYDQALGQSRLQASQAGFGYAPSGIQAGIESSLGRDRARSTSEAYLNNLLENEKVKFQAAGAKSDVLGKAASLYNPAAFAGPANTSNANAYTMANQNPSTFSTVLGAGSNLLGSFLKKKSTAPTFNPGAGGGTGQSGKTLMPWQ